MIFFSKHLSRRRCLCLFLYVSLTNEFTFRVLLRYTCKLSKLIKGIVALLVTFLAWRLLLVTLLLTSGTRCING